MSKSCQENPIIAMTPSACHLATQARGCQGTKRQLPSVLELPFGVVPTASPADWNCHLPIFLFVYHGLLFVHLS